jgi:hypothetical protein
MAVDCFPNRVERLKRGSENDRSQAKRSIDSV